MEFQLTKEIMESARDYLTLAEKCAWVDAVAPHCIDAMKITIGEDNQQMPDMFIISHDRKSRFLMTALVMIYMGISIPDMDDKPITDCMSAEDYDVYAGAHIINQIERMKSDAKLRSKCFDLLADYKDLTKRLSMQIEGLVAVQNDSVVRQSMAMVDEMTKLPALLDELKKYADEKEKSK